jgi:predicted kinase
MAIAHMIYGYIGVGKTTFAKRLEQRFAAVRFTHDDWMARLFGEDPPADHYAEYVRRIDILMESYWTRCLELGIDVVLDLGFWRRSQRDEIRQKVAGVGASSRIYRVWCPDDEAWRRVDQRNKDNDKTLYIARNTYDVLRSRVEELGADEEYEDAQGGR